MRSRREQVITGVAAVLILGLALWLLLGRSPGPARTTVDLGQAVATDAGRVTVLEVIPVPPGTGGTPSPEPGHTLVAIQFRSCRSDPNGLVVELSRFGIETRRGVVPVAGSRMAESTETCASGVVYAQVPQGWGPDAVQYDADPVGVWRLAGTLTAP